MPVHVNNVNNEVSVGLKIHEVQGATVLHFHGELNPTMLLVQVLK